MNVALIHHNPDALNLLLFTKQTRLAQSPGLLDEIRQWPQKRKLKELDYMLGTIQSSWEFCDYVFLIDGVSRAFTHQLVRTRQGSYAQQSQRTVDMSGFEYNRPNALIVDDLKNPLGTEIGGNRAWELAGSVGKFPEEGNPTNIYDQTMDVIALAYERMLKLGVNPQDARGVLPTNICTNIVGKFNLRTLSEMARLRLCTRTQGEYQDVFRLMRSAVIAVHPWAEPFLRVACAATGVCQFPNYMECPIKGPVYNPDTGLRWDLASESETLRDDNTGMLETIVAPKRPATRSEIQALWEELRFEAVPKQVTT